MALEEKYGQIRVWLLLKLSRLRQEVETNLMEMDSDKHHLADLEELASNVNVDEAVFEQFRSNAESIQQIEKAIERLDAGSYGQCEKCGVQIGEERLDALPFATQCVQCKRREEVRK